MTTVVDGPSSSRGEWHFRLFGVPVRVHPWFWVTTVFLGMNQDVGVVSLTGIVAFVVVLWLFRYVSLASLTAAFSSLITCFLLDLTWPVKAFAAFAAAVVLVRHRTNIGRLFHGTEPLIEGHQ